MAIAPDKPWSIYVLKDGYTDEIRYVGWTVKKLGQRLSAHMAEAKKKPLSHKSRWINVQVNSGTKPTIHEIDSGVGSGWAEKERWWIRHYRENGYSLTNICDGGEGTPGKLHSKETREKIGNAHRGKPGHAHSDESRERMSIAKLGKKGTPHTQSTKLAMSIARKGLKRSPEAIEKGASKLRGRPQSDQEHIANVERQRARSLMVVPASVVLEIYAEYLVIKGNTTKAQSGTANYLSDKYHVKLSRVLKIMKKRHWLVQENP